MKTALIIIDIQNDYFAGGAYPLFEPVKAVQNATLLLAKFRELEFDREKIAASSMHRAFKAAMSEFFAKVRLSAEIFDSA